MRFVSSSLLALGLISAPLYRIHAGCRADSSATTPRTLADAAHIAAFHVDEGGGSARVNGVGRDLMEMRIGVALCWWPDLTLMAVNGMHMEGITTTYVSPRADGFHPALWVSSDGFEVQRRWRGNSIFHPMASLGMGTLHTQYHGGYSQDGAWAAVDESERSTRYYTPAIGLEASLFTYVTVYGLFGSRFAGTTGQPGLQPHAFNGAYSTVMVALGKFR